MKVCMIYALIFAQIDIVNAYLFVIFWKDAQESGNSECSIWQEVLGRFLSSSEHSLFSQRTLLRFWAPTRWLITCNSSPRGSDTLWPQWTPGIHAIHIHTHVTVEQDGRCMCCWLSLPLSLSPFSSSFPSSSSPTIFLSLCNWTSLVLLGSAVLPAQRLGVRTHAVVFFHVRQESSLWGKPVLVFSGLQMLRTCYQNFCRGWRTACDLTAILTAFPGCFPRVPDVLGTLTFLFLWWTDCSSLKAPYLVYFCLEYSSQLFIWFIFFIFWCRFLSKCHQLSGPSLSTLSAVVPRHVPSVLLHDGFWALLSVYLCSHSHSHLGSNKAGALFLSTVSPAPSSSGDIFVLSTNKWQLLEKPFVLGASVFPTF